MLIKKKLYKVAVPENQYVFRANLFMWPGCTLFFGPLHALDFHSMGAIAINVGLYQPFLMKTINGMFKPYHCAIIPAGCKHELNAFGNIVASLIIEKNSTEYTYLRKLAPFHTSKITNLADSKWIECFQKIYQQKPTKTEIYQLLNQLLNADNETDKNVDPRIDRTMETIRLDPGNDFSQEYLAASVELSSSRFRHLFREQSDVSYRRYRMWQRVVSAMNILHKVDNLTYAAMEAGFTDSAHFNRCFRDTFGVNPSLVFKNMDRFET
ncbi:MAG: helix-turn-helix transcriptional regulator [Methylococcales bacterium]|nr:helix-turn-helix transcriptional regulator [Methylococcales bacterium]